MRLLPVAIFFSLLSSLPCLPQDLSTSAKPEDAPSSATSTVTANQMTVDVQKAHDVYLGSVGRRIARGFEYDFQRVEQPAFVVTGSGSLVHNPEAYLNEHTLKFVFSEVFPNTATLAGAWKNACGLVGEAAECQELKGEKSNLPGFDFKSIVTAGGWWHRAAAGLTMNVDLSERAALQQGVLVVNPSFSNHYQVTGGVDFDPSALFLNGSNWSKALDPFKRSAPLCAQKVRAAIQKGEDPYQAKIGCVRDLSLARLRGESDRDRDRATSLLAAVIPAISYKRVSQFDFVKNGGILIPAPYLANAQNQLTLKWDLKKAFPGPTNMLDAAATQEKKDQSGNVDLHSPAGAGNRLCVIVSGGVSSVIAVSQEFPAGSCKQFAAAQSNAEFRLACVEGKQITQGALHRPGDPSVTPDAQNEACWIEKD